MENNTIQRRKKPDFIRQGGKRYKRLAQVWRRPRGIHSKSRRKFKGHEKQPSIGYGSNKVIRGLNRAGLKEVLVKTLLDLNKIEKKSEVGILHRRLGTRKKVLILKKAKELNLPISNVKNIDDYLKKIEENVSQRRTETKKKLEERKQTKEKAVKVAEEKKTNEEKKEETKKEETKKAIEGLDKKTEQKSDEKQIKQVSKDVTKALQRRVTST